MANKRPVSTLVITCILAAPAGMPVFAMDLSIAPSSMAASASSLSSTAERKSKSRSGEQNAAKAGVKAGKTDQKIEALTAGDKARRREKFRYHRITTYSLFNKRDFLHGDSRLGGQHGLGLTSGARAFSPDLGSAGQPPSVVLNALPGTPMTTLHKQQPDENVGIAFACREKSSLTAREVTACYVHKVDRAWKTQTYVTKGLADSNPGWGGGLSVGYAY